MRLATDTGSSAAVTELPRQIKKLRAQRERRRYATGPCIEANNQKRGQEMTACFGLYGQEAPICEPLVTATRPCLPMCPGIRRAE